VKKLAVRFSVWLIFLLVILYYQPIRDIIDIQGGMTDILLQIVTSLLHFMHVEVMRQGLFLHQASSIFEINDACNGLILYALYLASILAFPGKWTGKLIWMIVGFIVIEAMNIFRLICLSFIIEHWYSYFNFFHYVFFQALLIASAIFLLFLYMKNNTFNLR